MNSTPQRPKREPVLIVTHGDGHIDVFGENVNANIVAMPYVGENWPTAQAEDFLEESLPPYWRKLFFPGLIRASGDTKPVTPTKIAASRAAEVAMRELAKLNPTGRQSNAASDLSSTLSVSEGAA